MSHNPRHSPKKNNQHESLLDPKEILWIKGRERVVKKSESETSVKISSTTLERKSVKKSKKSRHRKQQPRPEPELEPEIGDSTCFSKASSMQSKASVASAPEKVEQEEPVKLQSILQKSRPTVTSGGLTIVRPTTRVRIHIDEDDQNSASVSTRAKARERARAQRKFQIPEPIISSKPLRKYFGLLDLRKPRAERGIHPYHVAVASGFVIRRQKIERKPRKPKPRHTSVLVPGEDEPESEMAVSLFKEVKQSIKRGLWNVVGSFSHWNPFPGAHFRQHEENPEEGKEDEVENLPELHIQRKREILHEAISTVHAIDAMFAESGYRSSRVISVENQAAEQRMEKSQRQERELLNYVPRTQFTSQFKHLLPQARWPESTYREYRRRRPI